MIKGINLIPAEIKSNWRLKKIRRLIAVAAVCYLAAIAALYVNQRMTLAARSAELESLRKEKTLIAEKSAEYSSLKARLEEISRSETALNKRLALATGLAEGRISWSYILRRLSNDIPKGVWLRSLSTSDMDAGKGKSVRFLGSAISNRAVAGLIFTLENSGYLSDVVLSYTQKRDFDSKTVFDFEVTGALRMSAEVMHGR